MSSSPKAAICAIAKNEGPYIAEWAIYHRLIGFDHILIYENDSSDNTRKILALLESAGLVKWKPWIRPADGKTQKDAYLDGLSEIRQSCDWIAFIDIDEFLVLPGVDEIHTFLERIDEEVALAIHWKIFGTSGFEKKEPGLVIERFTHASLPEHSDNRAVKTLARCNAIERPNLHNHTWAPGVEYRNIAGEVIEPAKGQSKGSAIHEPIRLNHYFTKSREEWDQKAARGRADRPEGHPDKFRTEDHFSRNNRNEQRDDYLLKFVPTIKARLAALGLPSE